MQRLGKICFLLLVLVVPLSQAQGASIEVTSEAAGVGNYGLAVTLEPNPGTVAYVEKTIPAGNAFRLRFKWRAGTLERWGEGDPATTGDNPRLAIVFVKEDPVSNASANRMANLWLSVRNEQWVFWTYCRRNDLTTASSPVLTLPVSVTDANAHLQMDFEIRPSSAPGVADGSCCLRVEGVGEVCEEGIPNDLIEYGAMSIGATIPVFMPSDAAGTFHMDEVIVSN
jgi:hypothetical protein